LCRIFLGHPVEWLCCQRFSYSYHY